MSQLYYLKEKHTSVQTILKKHYTMFDRFNHPQVGNIT